MSILQTTIDAVSDTHNLFPGIDSNKKIGQPGGCCLSSGIEYSFVNSFCQEIFRRLPQENLPDYHQVFYIPNLQAEAKVGYDLSIGHYRQNCRIRTMHKVINERYCDRPWSFRFNFLKNEKEEDSGDYGHFIKLTQNGVQDDLEYPNAHISPYLVLNICYCIHDYRRMGLFYEPEQVTIPPLASLLRTVIIDLHALRGQINQLHVNCFSTSFYIKIYRTPERKLGGETSQDFLGRINTKENIFLVCGDNEQEKVELARDVILNFDEFIQRHNWAQIMQLG